MSNNIYIALYISSHGFGHMTRCLAVVDYILKNSTYNIYIACDKNLEFKGVKFNAEYLDFYIIAERRTWTNWGN